MSDAPLVSVVIAARNAATTLEDTIASLAVQTVSHWEATIVDDGSSDGTVALAESLAASDSRIRVVTQPAAGVCAARQHGTELASSDWMLYLDADDWLAPAYMERMLAECTPDVDAVYCGWARVTPDGRVGQMELEKAPNGLFDVLAQRCAFAIHACVFRRRLVEAVGGWDRTLRVAEDWDLWQRFARAGARFVRVDELLAFYRMRPGSASNNAERLLHDGLVVIERGHSVDARAADGPVDLSDGRDRRGLELSKFYFAVWGAGLSVGAGGDVAAALRIIRNLDVADADPEALAACLIESVLLPRAEITEDWPRIWDDVKPAIEQLLADIEDSIEHEGLARRTERALEDKLLEPPFESPRTVGRMHALRVDTTQPVNAVLIPARCDRLRCEVTDGVESLGTLDLPVFGGVVTAYVVRDAVAERFGWHLLGRFLSETIYRDLTVIEATDGTRADRGDVCLARHFADRARLHDEVGWLVFLQELWGRPDWPQSRFYDSTLPEDAPALELGDAEEIAIDVTEPLPCLRSWRATIAVRVAMGGATMATLPVAVVDGRIEPSRLRAEINLRFGAELFRVAVREAILGWPADSMDLRARLRKVAEGGDPVYKREGCVTLSLRSAHGIGGSPSRRAELPIEALDEIEAMANACGERISMPAKEPRRVVYAADPTVEQPAMSDAVSREHGVRWNHATAYEQTKYNQALLVLQGRHAGSALQLGCGDGRFTELLASRVGRVHATDVSATAVASTAARCRALANVTTATLDFLKEPLGGPYDLIACNEALYCADAESVTQLGERAAAALGPGGRLLITHANLAVDDPSSPGFAWDLPFGANGIADALAAVPALELTRELRTPLYRVQLYERAARRAWSRTRRIPEITTAHHGTLAAWMASQVYWANEDVPISAERPVSTSALPVLMYHRVAPAGSARAGRYRLTPDAFDAQLRFLRDQGFHSVRLDEWHDAVLTRTPLPGRAVLLTFDDGYHDFLEHAWPLLTRYGFNAIVFVVAGQVGQTNAWDKRLCEQVRLLDWADIRRLRNEGCEFGSHTLTHPHLRGRSWAQVVREAAASRAILARELGGPVRALAYPYGDVDEVIAHLAGACGYEFGVTCDNAHATFADSLLTIPRVEITGNMPLDAFAEAVGVPKSMEKREGIVTEEEQDAIPVAL